MQTASIKKNDPEVFYCICRNTEASADFADGEVAVWDVTTTAGRIQGLDVIKASGAAIQLTVAGVASGVIKNAGLGRVQTFGFHPSVKTSAVALAAGATCTTSATVAAAVDAGAVGDDPSARLGVCLKSGSANKAGIFIKCM